METRNDVDRGVSYDPSTAPAPPKASLFEDFIDMFHAPSQVFARRAEGGYGLHLLIITAIAAAFAFANRGYMRQIFAAEADRANQQILARNPQMTAEMLERSRGFQEGIGLFFSYLGTPVIIMVMAVFVWIVARWVAGARISYGRAALITTLAWIPRLLGMFVTTLQVALMDTSNETDMFGLSASPARFLDRDAMNPKLYGIAGSFELFSIWSLILVGIGIAVVGKVPRAKGYIAAALLFVVAMVPMLLR